MTMRRRNGFTLIELLTVVTIIGVLLALLLPAVQATREAGRLTQCRNNLKQIGVALANYQISIGVYPFGVGGSGPPGYVPRWSALSQLLPQLDQQALFNSMNFNGIPWSGVVAVSLMNETAITTKVAVFLCPSDWDAIDEKQGLAHLNYRASAGTLPYNLTFATPNNAGKNDGTFYFQSDVRPSSIPDGLSTTACFSERCLGSSAGPDRLSDYYVTEQATVQACANAAGGSSRYAFDEIEWSGQRWADGNVFYSRYQHILTPNQPSCNFGADDYQGEAIVTATSRHPRGVAVLMADGSVQFVKETISSAVWTALGTTGGGDVVDSGGY
jgi:prepilin-type N-terminal cleavage/methylation domain-containing protein/prepilin-type processing-associated H-X9-DG protein